MRLPSISMGCFIFFMKSSGLSFWNSDHSVTIMQQSAFFMQSSAEVAYWILLLKMVFAVGTATGS